MSAVTSAIVSYYEEPLRELRAIATAHQGCKDHLSRRIYKWINTIPSQQLLRSRNPSDIHALVTQKVHDLRDQILINPFNRAPLENPVLDGPWVWEERSLKFYKSLCNLSPFTQQIFDVKPHPFAAAMIVWANKLALLQGLTSSVNTPAALIPGIKEEPLSDEGQLITRDLQFILTACNTAAQYIMAGQEYWDRTDTMEQDTRKLALLSLKTREGCADLEAESRQKEIDFKKDMERVIADLAESQRQERVLQQTRIHEEQKRIERAQEDLLRTSVEREALASRVEYERSRLASQK